MKYISKTDVSQGKAIALDDMILTTEFPTTAGSKMLDGYVSLFEAEVVTRLKKAGYSVSGKANVGEMAIDLLGETSYFGACTDEKGNLMSASALLVKEGEVDSAICFDANGAPRRAAAISDLVYVKPTYGTVSRYGTIPAVCSGECVGVMARTADECKSALSAILGHDSKDGTSLSDEKCDVLSKACNAPKRVAIIKALCNDIDAKTKEKIEQARVALTQKGIEACEIDSEIIAKAKIAWNILMSAELCNNVSRYDGVKYGYRTPNYKTIEELYTNSRTEAFGELLKTAILYGSDALSTENYMKVYDKALRTRRLVCEEFAKIFADFDAVMIPACSKMEYTLESTKENKYISFDEALYTAPASITGLPTVVANGVQLIGKAFSEKMLFDIADMCEKEGK